MAVGAQFQDKIAHMGNLFTVFLLLMLGWFWLDSLRTREIAVEICRTACAESQLQFLDQAVVLRRLGLRWTNAGVRFRRLYRFDFSEGGVGRRSGYLILVGLDLEDFSFGLPEQSGDA